MSLDHDEQLAALKANVDQAVMGAAEIARAVGAYFNSLLAQGFTRDEALTLTRDWQASFGDGDDDQ